MRYNFKSNSKINADHDFKSNVKSNSYFVREYTYSIRNYGEQTGSTMKIWDGNEPYYFFAEVAKSLYNYLMGKTNDLVKIIVWKGVLYEHVNPQDVFSGIFTFRSSYGMERNIDIRRYLK